jgi:hypothetical protein
MKALELSREESTLLREVCEESLSDLRMEIARTDLMDYREALKAKEARLKAILDRLAA